MQTTDKIFVTRVAGFIGARLVQALIEGVREEAKSARHAA
jgi:hypothetical protein